MGKRGAEKQITQDDKLSDDDEPQGGSMMGFKKASAEELARRKIVRIKRKAPAGGDGGADSGAGKSPFGNFSFSAGKEAAKPNPFKGFSGLTGASSSSSSSSNSSLVMKSGGFSFGSTSNPPSVPSFPAPTKPKSPGFTLGTLGTEASTGSKSTGGGEAFVDKMRELNTTMLKWMEYQREAAPTDSWQGAMEDYISHCVKLRETFGVPERPESEAVATKSKSSNSGSGSSSSAKSKGGSPQSGTPAAVEGGEKKKSPGVTAGDVLAFFGKGKGKGNGSSSDSAKKSEEKERGKEPPVASFSFSAPGGGFGFQAASAPAAEKDKEKEQGGQPEGSKTAAAAANAWSAGASAPTSASGFASMKVPDFSAPAPQPLDKGFGLSFGSGPGFGSTSGSSGSGGSTGTGGIPGFSFGGSVPAFGSGSIPALAAASSAPKPPSFGGFGASIAGAGAGAVAGAGAGAGEAAAGAEDGEEFAILEPEKLLRNEEDKDEVLLETPCLLKRLDLVNKEWKDCGKGTLRVTKDPDTGKQRIIVRELTMGKVTLNTAFFGTQKFKKMGKRLDTLQFPALVINPNPVDPDAPPGSHKETSLETYTVKLKAEMVDKAVAALEAGVKSVAAAA